MHVVFIIPYFYPAWEYGGQPRSAFELAKGLVRLGHRVTVLTTDSGGSKRLQNRSAAEGNHNVEGIEVFYYRNISNSLAFHYRIFWPPGFFRNIRTHLSGADVVHIHELRSSLTVAAFHAATQIPIPVVLSTHGGLRHLGRKAVKTVFDKLWGSRILKSIDALIAVSLIEEQEAKRLRVTSGRIREVPNAICESDYKLPSDLRAFRSKWDIGDDRRLVLFLGRLHWVKGADVLLRAFSDLCKDPTVNAQLVLAGPDDGQEAELRHLVAELELATRVTFAGFLNMKEKLEAFASADLVVIPSRSEVFAITALEALLCSRPVLVSSVCGLAPLLSEKEGLMTFAVDDEQSLARNLETALQDNQLKDAASRGREFVRREFSLSVVAQKAADVYREVIWSRSNRAS